MFAVTLVLEPATLPFTDLPFFKAIIYGFAVLVLEFLKSEFRFGLPSPRLNFVFGNPAMDSFADWAKGL